MHSTEGKVIYPVQVRYTVKVELTQFFDNTQQDAHEFLVAISNGVSSVLQCKSCKYQSIKKEVLSWIEVPVPEIGVASLENCLERWLAADEVPDWKCASCSQCGSGVKKLVLEAVPELLIIQLKRFRKAEKLFKSTWKFISKWNSLRTRKW